MTIDLKSDVSIRTILAEFRAKDREIRSELDCLLLELESNKCCNLKYLKLIHAIFKYSELRNVIKFELELLGIEEEFLEVSLCFEYGSQLSSYLNSVSQMRELGPITKDAAINLRKFNSLRNMLYGESD